MIIRILFLTVMALSFQDRLCSQIVIDENDMPMTGDMIPFSVTTILPDGVDPALTGEDVVWDYSLLSPGVNSVDTFYTVEQTPFIFQFFFNNGFLYPDHQADHARKEMSVNLGLVNITDAYSYFKSDEEGYRNVGFGANVNGIPSSVRNVPIDWIYEFPLEYLDESVSPSASELEIPTIGYYSHDQVREVMVEGWGTLILSDQSYEVLKVKMIVNATDSVYIESLETGFPVVQPEQTIYQWLAIGEGEPLLQISQQVGFGYTVRFRYDDAVSLDEAEDISMSIFPNPSTNQLNVNLGAHILRSYSLFNAAGNLVGQREVKKGNGIVPIPIHSLASGQYVLLIQLEEGSYYSTFIKE